MSESKDTIDITYLKDTFLECPVCLEHFNESERCPRILHSCLHAVCTQCLQQLLDTEGKGQINCPLCRKVQKIPGNAKSVPIDGVRYKLVECVETLHGGIELCKDCPDRKPAESSCKECSLNLCSECTSVHRRHRLTSDHVITPLLPQQKPVAKGHYCHRHTSHLLEFFCITDDTACCLSCTVLDHKGHTLENLQDVAMKRSRELETAMQNLQALTGRLKNEAEAMKRRKRKLQQSANDAKYHASQFLARLECAIKKSEDHINAEIDEKCRSMVSRAEKNIEATKSSLTLIESRMLYFKQAKERGDIMAMLQMYPSIKDGFKESFGQCQPETEETVVSFTACHGPLLETLISKVGYVTTTTDSTQHAVKHDFMSLLNRICVEASESLGRKELQQYLKQKVEALESEPCRKCLTGKGAITLQCRHIICKVCLVVKEQLLCPVCKTGCMPPGEMNTTVIPDELPGNRKYDTIMIRYVFLGGIQAKGHPKPGTQYHGDTFTAYLPNSPEGQKVLALLKVAWKRKLTFQIYHDPLGLYLLKYCIHHKTSKVRDASKVGDGYPDRDYLRKVQEQLAELGVTEDCLK
ncbi:tripartite motif-containing protein 42-like [Haliotis asinina]|uniref:tripartite motif-containing protein 42-like n=1 Tax=Haliotis asinina TaxID=109174 RepID=UPI0035318D9D